jgi:hypothetical protein
MTADGPVYLVVMPGRVTATGPYWRFGSHYLEKQQGDMTMRYMMIKATKSSEAGVPPSQELMAGMAKLTEEMMKAGVLLASDGLQPSSKGTRIRYTGGKRTVIDGPFAETKELLGGYAILRAKSKEEVIELADRAIEVHIKAGIPEVELEIRPLFDPPDFGPANR